MGMFDSFYNVPISCPKCETDMSGEEFQTKDLDCILNHYYFPTVVTDQLNYFHFYTSCQKCKEWIELRVILERGFTVKIETDGGQVLWELDKLGILVKLSNEREQFRHESRHRVSVACGLAAFIWKHHKDKRDKLFKVLVKQLGITKSDFEKFSVQSCYNPGSYGFGIIGGPQNYCWVLEGKAQKETLEETKKYHKILKDLPVGKERSEMVCALVWTEEEGVVEKGPL